MVSISTCVSIALSTNLSQKQYANDSNNSNYDEKTKQKYYVNTWCIVSIRSPDKNVQTIAWLTSKRLLCERNGVVGHGRARALQYMVVSYCATCALVYVVCCVHGDHKIPLRLTPPTGFLNTNLILYRRPSHRAEILQTAAAAAYSHCSAYNIIVIERSAPRKSFPRENRVKRVGGVRERCDGFQKCRLVYYIVYDKSLWCLRCTFIYWHVYAGLVNPNTAAAAKPNDVVIRADLRPITSL